MNGCHSLVFGHVTGLILSLPQGKDKKGMTSHYYDTTSQHHRSSRLASGIIETDSIIEVLGGRKSLSITCNNN